MTLLLDSHAFLWWVEGSRKLGKRARQRIESAGVVWVSAATVWELAIKTALGRLHLGEPAATLVPREMDRSGFQPLGISVSHALDAAALPRHHDDPFDRMLIAQALTDELTIVTADGTFDRYGVPTLDASA